MRLPTDDPEMLADAIEALEAAGFVRVERIPGETTTELRLQPTAKLRERFNGITLTDLRRPPRR